MEIDDTGFEDSQKLSINTLLKDDQYKVTDHLGGGGFSITYLGVKLSFISDNYFRDRTVLETPEPVVIKELFTRECERSDQGEVEPRKHFIKDFKKLLRNHFTEGKRIRYLIHPNIVEVKDIFEQYGTAYLILQFLPGHDIYGMLRKRKKLGKSEAFLLIRQVLSALKFIHSNRYMHLDISPGNIMISEDGRKATLIDFGISQVYDEDKRIVLTTTNEYMAGMKPKYASPEQWSRESIREFRAQYDTYAVVATLYFLLSGEEVPDYDEIRDNESSVSLKGKMKEEEYSEFLDQIIYQGIHPTFWGRYNTVDELLEALDAEAGYNDHLLQLSQLMDRGNKMQVLEYIETQMKPYHRMTKLAELKKIHEQSQQEETKNENRTYFQSGTNSFGKEQFLEAREALKLAEQFDEANRPVAKILLAACEEKIREKHSADHRQHLEKGKLFESAGNLEAALDEFAQAKKLYETAELLEKIKHVSLLISNGKRQNELIERIKGNLSIKNFDIARFTLNQLKSEFPESDTSLLQAEFPIEKRPVAGVDQKDRFQAQFVVPKSSQGLDPIASFSEYLNKRKEEQKNKTGNDVVSKARQDRLDNPRDIFGIKRPVLETPILGDLKAADPKNTDGKLPHIAITSLFGKRREGILGVPEKKNGTGNGAVPLIKDGARVNAKGNNFAASTVEDAERPLLNKGKRIKANIFSWPLWGIIAFLFKRIWTGNFLFWTITVLLILFFGYNLFIDNAPLKWLDSRF